MTKFFFIYTCMWDHVFQNVGAKDCYAEQNKACITIS